jgi:Cof subfamily protein (haloacid dehalogenase superfamily)
LNPSSGAAPGSANVELPAGSRRAVPARPAVRLIATDLDGTLLRSDGSLSSVTRDSLLAAHEAGIEVVPATGRPRMVSGDVIAELPFVHHWVFANGSVTWHAGRSELIRGFWLDPDEVQRLIVAIRAVLPGAGFAVEFEDTVAYEHGFEAVVPQLPAVPPTPHLLSEIDRRVQKLLVFDPDLTVDELYRVTSAVLDGDAVPTYSGLAFVEVAAGLVTKATALQHLADDLGIGAAEVAAFGDNHNDVAMLGWAGRSYAMGHATDDARDTAGEVIGSNDDDAVAAKIDELVAEAG